MCLTALHTGWDHQPDSRLNYSAHCLSVLVHWIIAKICGAVCVDLHWFVPTSREHHVKTVFKNLFGVSRYSLLILRAGVGLDGGRAKEQWRVSTPPSDGTSPPSTPEHTAPPARAPDALIHLPAATTHVNLCWPGTKVREGHQGMILSRLLLHWDKAADMLLISPNYMQLIGGRRIVSLTSYWCQVMSYMDPFTMKHYDWRWRDLFTCKTFILYSLYMRKSTNVSASSPS